MSTAYHFYAAVYKIGSSEPSRMSSGVMNRGRSIHDSDDYKQVVEQLRAGMKPTEKEVMVVHSLARL